jgi:hypothetical protein
LYPQQDSTGRCDFHRKTRLAWLKPVKGAEILGISKR